MKTILAMLLFLTALNANATSCGVSVFLPDGSGHGRSGDSGGLSGIFSTGTGAIQLDKYRFVLDATTQEKSEILTVDVLNPAARQVLKEQNNLAESGANPIWQIELTDEQNTISISCK